MSDDLFWPPVSGDGDDDPQRPQGVSGDGEHPTAAYDTEPLFVSSDEDDTHGSAASVAPRRDHSRSVATIGVVAIITFVFGAGGVLVGAKAFNNNNSPSESGGVIPAAPSGGASASPSALNTTPKSYAAIAAKVLPSVVSINVTGSSESDTGSGVILKSNGYILTNNHVVAAAVSSGSSGSVSVTFNDGSTAKATIVGTDSLDDLAVIKVAKSGLSAAALGNSSVIAVGDPVLAVGSPLGLTGTVTAGIVSSLNRPVETQSDTQTQTSPFGGSSTTPTQPTVIDAIQTDAAINPGNSGGALVNSVGQVIGINSAIASLGTSSLSGSTQSGSIGVGFAIPVNQARTIANELISTGHAIHPLLGVSLEDSTSRTGLDSAVVHAVTSGGPAAKAGIKSGDIITAVDGQPTAGVDAVIAAIRSHQPGEKVTLSVERSGSTQSITATLTAESSTQD